MQGKGPKQQQNMHLQTLIAILVLSQLQGTWGRYFKPRGRYSTGEVNPTEPSTTSTSTWLPSTTSLATLASSTQPETTTTRLLDLCPRQCRDQLANFAQLKLVNSPAPSTEDPNENDSEEQFTRLLNSLDTAFINLVSLSVWVMP